MKHDGIIGGSAVLAAMAVVALAVWFGAPSKGLAEGSGTKESAKELYPVGKHGLHSFYMRQLFTRYGEAGKYFEKGDMAMAEANLDVMLLFLEQLEDDRTRYTAQKVSEDKVQLGKDTLASIRKQVEDIRSGLAEKKWPADVDGKDPVLENCLSCHKGFGVVENVLDTAETEGCALSSRAVYELYVQAGYYMKKEEWDKARLSIMVLRPYIEDLPKDIPEKNKKGEAVDKEMFMKSYEELGRYTDGLVKKLEDKNWEGGKPLPPPHLLIDTCYSCHEKAAKIPEPW